MRLLDSHTVNQIAAGEVVERPASVVKELIENALDAGARRIEVIAREAGRALIEVSDDGSGMSPEDARLALERHATSKIRLASDLSAVTTLGFRGEALPSIASVARLVLSTGLEDGSRIVLEVEAGRVAEPRREAGPRGTRIAVHDLFFNTPARLKFLRTDATESAAIVEVVSRAALAFPHVAFRLTQGSSGGSASVETTGSGDLLTATAEVWGREIARALVAVDLAIGGVRVRGLVSPPYFTRPTRAYQWLTVNGRSVRSKTITAALDGAYRSLTPEKRYPVALLEVHVEPAGLDANVSPTKSEVRFRDERTVFDAVRQAVRQALLAQGMIPSAEELANANAALAEARGVGEGAPAGYLVPGGVGPDGMGGSGGGGLGGAYGGVAGGVFGGSGSLSPAHLQAAFQAQAPLLGLGVEPAGEPYRATDLLDGLRVLGQLMRTFIVAENRRGLLIVDQHVAHERILYERLKNAALAGEVERQSLLVPETLDLDARAFGLLMGRLPELRDAGFEIEPFGGESFLVRAAPAALKGRDPVRALRDMAEELAHGGGRGCVDVREGIWAMCSCKMAVKAGDTLGVAEMEKLLEDLAQTENPYFCPHGRPITIVMAAHDLLRKFKRA